jgi:hypothetical protein
MSEVINPPDYYFTGINFNPAFYAEDTGGLTQATANALYLRKTVPDTATAQETFTSGIVTPTINSTSTGFLNIVVPMATSGSGLNVAVAPRTIAGQVHHYSDGDNCVAGAGVHLNNGINNNSATNIHNGTGANPTGVVNIMTGTSSTGTVNIGATGTTTNIKGASINLNTTVGASTGLFTTGRSYFGGTTSATFAANNFSQVDATYRDIMVMHATATNGMAFTLFKGLGGTAAGSIDNNGLGTGVAYATSSDRRLKTNIQPMSSMLNNMMKLKPSKYNWVSNTDIEDYGFIAQEVFELFPEMRNKRFNTNDNLDEPCDENGVPIHYGLDYGKFTPYMVKAFQELKEEYDAKLSNLEARLLTLEPKPLTVSPVNDEFIKDAPPHAEATE